MGPLAVIFLYITPIGLTVLAAAMILAGVQLRPPDKAVAFAEGLFARASGLVGVRRAASAG
jgi:hypothetical protein